jgi:hypothetical protein
MIRAKTKTMAGCAPFFSGIKSVPASLISPLGPLAKVTFSRV